MLRALDDLIGWFFLDILRTWVCPKLKRVQLWRQSKYEEKRLLG